MIKSRWRILKEIDNVLYYLDEKRKNATGNKCNKADEEYKRIAKLGKELMWFFKEY